jgi:mannose-1-phosphate guanylyltransferase / phosphomannomutase
LTDQDRTLGQIRAELPRITHKSQTVRCPWSVKGALMRHLIQTHPPQNLEMVDGVKICNYHDDSWVLILPDAGEPLVHIYTNSGDRSWAEENLREYRYRVQEFVEENQSNEDLLYKS